MERETGRVRNVHRNNDPRQLQRQPQTTSQVQPAECTKVLLDLVEADKLEPDDASVLLPSEEEGSEAAKSAFKRLDSVVAEVKAGVGFVNGVCEK